MHPSAPVLFLRRGDSGEGDSHHLDQESCDGTRSLATEVRQVGSRICRFCSRSPILMVARTNRDDAHETPRHAPPRRPKPRRGQSSFRQSPFRHGVRGIPSQPTRSTVVHLEVFTSRATHASPLHRFIDPTARGMHPSAPVSFLRRGDSGEGEEKGTRGGEGSPARSEKGTVIIWTRSLATEVRQVRDPESADFAADHRSSWSRGRNDAHETPRHAILGL